VSDFVRNHLQQLVLRPYQGFHLLLNLVIGLGDRCAGGIAVFHLFEMG